MDGKIFLEIEGNLGVYQRGDGGKNYVFRFVLEMLVDASFVCRTKGYCIISCHLYVLIPGVPKEFPDVYKFIAHKTDLDSVEFSE